MSAASCLLTEDQFLCSICLDVFTDPVTTPCGHNFCKTCITQHWNVNVQTQCPNCKKLFYTRPELQVNTFISEMAAQFRQSAQQKASSSSSEQQAAKPGEVPCDVCTGTKLKALKSCLVCLESYCETHLEPHLTRSGLKRHQLIDPVENLEGRMCTKHDKLLELFCKTDQMCVCMLCTVLDHKNHDVVPLKEEYEGKKAKLGKTDAEIQQMIQKRRLTIQEIKHSVKISVKDADREIADGVQVFTALMESVERRMNELIDTIKEKQRKTEKQAEGFIKELEQEISELKKRSTEVEQLSRSEDHLHLLQSFRALNTAPPTKNWTEVRVSPPSYEGTVVRALNQLEEMLSKQMKKLLTEAELKGFLAGSLGAKETRSPVDSLWAKGTSSLADSRSLADSLGAKETRSLVNTRVLADILGAKGTSSLADRLGAKGTSSLADRLGAKGTSSLADRLGAKGTSSLADRLGAKGTSSLADRLGAKGTSSLADRLGAKETRSLADSLWAKRTSSLADRLGAKGTSSLAYRLGAKGTF
ncbi:E3 ubiquitin/ISG15 ligase TRIM25-like [Lycodopsis pacificus]